MPDMAATYGWLTQQSHVLNQPTSTAILCQLCQCHQVENVTNIPNNSFQVFSMVKIFGKETTQNTTFKNINNIHMAITNCNWCIQTKSHHEQNQLLLYTWHGCHQPHYHHATEDETYQTFSAITMAVMPPNKYIQRWMYGWRPQQTPGYHFQHGWSSSDELFKWHTFNNQNHRLLQVIRQAAVYAMHSCDQHCNTQQSINNHNHPMGSRG